MLGVAGTSRLFQELEHIDNLATPLGGNGVEEGLHPACPGLAQARRGTSAGLRQGDGDAPSVVVDSAPFDPPTADQVGNETTDRALREPQALGEIALAQRARAQLTERMSFSDAGIESAWGPFRTVQPEAAHELHDGIREPLGIGHAHDPTTG